MEPQARVRGVAPNAPARKLESKLCSDIGCKVRCYDKDHESKHSGDIDSIPPK